MIPLKSKKEFDLILFQPPIIIRHFHRERSIRQSQGILSTAGSNSTNCVVAVHVRLNSKNLQVILQVRDGPEIAAVLDVEGAQGWGLSVPPESFDDVITLWRHRIEGCGDFEALSLVFGVGGVPANFISGNQPESERITAVCLENVQCFKAKEGLTDLVLARPDFSGGSL